MAQPFWTNVTPLSAPWLALIIAPATAYAKVAPHLAKHPAPGVPHAATAARPMHGSHAATPVQHRAAPRAAQARTYSYGTSRAAARGATPGNTAHAASPVAKAWNNGWRDDRRYDWIGWRASHREMFHPDYYYPPDRGYADARLGVGALLATEFLGEQYWIDDPAVYHLPPVWGPYRWVRYYNDCLLIDIDTGEVVDVA